MSERAIEAFLQHVGTGRIDHVRAGLATTPSLVNAVGPHPFWGGRPQALHVAIEAKRRDVFDLLLAHGADIDGDNEHYDRWSPLMLTINREQHDMRDELLRRGARVGLLEALMLGDDDRVRDLLDAHGLPDVAPNRGSILAFARTSYAIDRLIALGAPIDLRDRWGATPMEAMSRLGPAGERLVNQLAAHGVAVRPQELARLGDRQALERIAEADPDALRADAVMMSAVDFKHHDLVRWLLGKGANVNARTEASTRHTALHSAAWNGDLEMARILASAGADLAARDATYNGTPRGWATTSIEVTNNRACEEVAAYLAEVEGTP